MSRVARGTPVWRPRAIGTALVGAAMSLLAGCAPGYVGYAGNDGYYGDGGPPYYTGGYYEPYGYDYGGMGGGWGRGYHVGPGRGGDRGHDRPGHAYHAAPAAHRSPGIPGGGGGRKR